MPAGGLYYISEVEDEVRPLMRDPFFILGEHSYLLKLKTARRVLKDFPIKKGEKKFLDGDGYRLWFDYVTDHYQKPYAQLALISPAGHWPLEFPVSTHFQEMNEIKQHDFPEGDPSSSGISTLRTTYAYGASVFKAKEVTSTPWSSTPSSTRSSTRPCSPSAAPGPWSCARRIPAVQGQAHLRLPPPQRFPGAGDQPHRQRGAGREAGPPVLAAGLQGRRRPEEEYSLTPPNRTCTSRSCTTTTT